MGDLAASVDDVLLCLINDRIGSVLVVKVNDDRLPEDTRNDGERHSKESKGTHVGDLGSVG